jgi:hypothetical protein
MIYVTEFILVLPVTIIFAAWHAHLIEKQRPINHPLWALLFGVLLAAAMYWQRDHLHTIRQVGLFAPACCIGRLVVFNVSLNLFRGLSWTYISPTSTSVIDKVSMRLFGARVWLFEIVLGIVFIILQFYI